MTVLAKVTELWRYPVKSMGGESLEKALVLPQGLAGDRCWAVVDATDSEIRSAKRWPDLLQYRAAYSRIVPEAAVYNADVPPVMVSCPDGEALSSDASGFAEALGNKLGKSLRFEALRPAADKAHYRLAKARSESDFLTEMDMQEDEVFPDFSQAAPGIMAQLADHVTPPGSYVDAFPLHLMTVDSQQYLSEKAGVDAVTQRFRPNIVVQSERGEHSLLEESWVGARLKIGSTILRVDSKTVRCSMPGRAQQWAGLEAVPTMARAMVAHCERFLGVNILVEEAGEIALGDSVELLAE
jgi:uncharacterized protein YcbX